MSLDAIAAIGSLVPWLGSVAILAGVMRWAVVRGDTLSENHTRRLIRELERIQSERDALSEAWLSHRRQCPLYDTDPHQ